MVVVGVVVVVGIAVEAKRQNGHGLLCRADTTGKTRQRRRLRRRRWIADWVPGLVFSCGPLFRTTRQSSNSHHHSHHHQPIPAQSEKWKKKTRKSEEKQKTKTKLFFNFLYLLSMKFIWICHGIKRSHVSILISNANNNKEKEKKQKKNSGSEKDPHLLDGRRQTANWKVEWSRSPLLDSLSCSSLSYTDRVYTSHKHSALAAGCSSGRLEPVTDWKIWKKK